MKHSSPTLLIIAALATASGAHALSVKDDDMSLGLKMILQARADFASGSQPGGDEYNPTEDANMAGDSADFYLRRARFGFAGTWKGAYTFNFIARADGAEKTSSGSSTRTLQIYDATMGYKWGAKEDPINQAVTFGLQAAHFNTRYVHSSSALLLPTSNQLANSTLMSPRSAGVKYHLSHEIVKLWVDVQNNAGDSQGVVGYDNADGSKGEGLLYSARVHLSPPGEWNIASAAESYAGKPGQGVLVGLDFAQNNEDRVGTANAYDTTAWGVDVLFRYDGLTALAEYRTASREDENPANEERKSSGYRIQAGYAFPVGDQMLEPAVRFSSFDSDTDDDEQGNDFGTGDAGDSGTAIEIGVNYYLHGNHNKLQLSYLMWEGEENSAGDSYEADIVRFQWQLMF